LEVELQEALIENSELKKTVRELQEKLSAGYTREAGLEEKVQRYQKAVNNLSEQVRSAQMLQKKVESLTEQLEQKNEDTKTLEEGAEKLLEKCRGLVGQRNSLNESLAKKEQEVEELSETISELNSKLKKLTRESNDKVSSLKESLVTSKEELEIQNSRNQKKLEEQKKLVEHYKTIAMNALDSYIDKRAVMLGVSSKEIKSRLHENYTFEDVENVCESFYSFSQGIGKLPFDISERSRVKVSEQLDPIVKGSHTIVDNTVD